MNVAIIVATCGDTAWADIAKQCAYPSARAEADSMVGAGVVLRHYPTYSLAQARNAAAGETQKDWICHLDADDELESGYLDATEQAWEENATTGWEPLLAPKLRRVHQGGRLAQAAWPNMGKWPKINECVIGTVVSRKMFEGVGGFRDMTDGGVPISMYEDWDLWLRCWNSGARLLHTEAVYREHVNAEGRNTNAHLSQTMYDAIWADHVRDSAILGRDLDPRSPLR